MFCRTGFLQLLSADELFSGVLQRQSVSLTRHNTLQFLCLCPSMSTLRLVQRELFYYHCFAFSMFSFVSLCFSFFFLFTFFPLLFFPFWECFFFVLVFLFCPLFFLRYPFPFWFQTLPLFEDVKIRSLPSLPLPRVAAKNSNGRMIEECGPW